MFSRPAFIKLSIAAVIVFSSLGISPRSAAQGLQQQLEKQYPLTKPTDDKTDIVTAGAVLILQKDKIIMYSTGNQVQPQNIYKNGKLSEGVYGVHDSMQKFGSFIGHPPPQQTQTDSRQFVTGEKFWVTRIDTQPDGVVFWLFSDPYNDVRYDCSLKFAYPKGTTPSPDQVLSMVAEVFKVQEDDSAKSDNGGNQQQQGGDANQQPAAEQAPAEAAAPAEQAPPAAPATVAIGQTPDEVVAALGQPDKILNLGPKQIYVYKDLKVTFVKGKVTDAQ